ncbi:hypothetical protein AtubIFM56815_003865 [Aspergillus tubingensis]|uniref:Uncharacterized protein n=1 Tax=Aspergillus tubingensis TaxID=5068 RepID=A0A9W6AYY0_ASPTU|nr:hypothetical protein AtubIFM56815_003865 [Aspergillus tubingensis]
MHFNNVGLLATVLLASTASALPRIPQHGAVAAAGALDPLQKTGNLMQRSEANTATNDNEDLMYTYHGDDDVPKHRGFGGIRKTERSEAGTATNDNEDLMYTYHGDDDAPYHRGFGGIRKMERSEAGTATENGADIQIPHAPAGQDVGGVTQRSEEETASKENADFWGPGGGGYGGYGGNGDSNGQGGYY